MYIGFEGNEMLLVFSYTGATLKIATIPDPFPRIEKAVWIAISELLKGDDVVLFDKVLEKYLDKEKDESLKDKFVDKFSRLYYEDHAFNPEINAVKLFNKVYEALDGYGYMRNLFVNIVINIFKTISIKFHIVKDGPVESYLFFFHHDIGAIYINENCARLYTKINPYAFKTSTIKLEELIKEIKKEEENKEE